MAHITEIRAESASRTGKIGERIGKMLAPGDCILLTGALGAGKTTLAQGICRGLGVTQPVTSPTFVLVHEYRGRESPVFHLDLYRLDGSEDVADLGFDEMRDRGVILVEWAERLGLLAPDDHLAVEITPVRDDERSLRFTGAGERAECLLAALEAERC